MDRFKTYTERWYRLHWTDNEKELDRSLVIDCGIDGRPRVFESAENSSVVVNDTTPFDKCQNLLRNRRRRRLPKFLSVN
jgi:hypothetical protein